MTLVLCLSAAAGAADPVPDSPPVSHAPPPGPPGQFRKHADSSPPVAESLVGLSVYSIGSPTDEEQWYVELINRARANPGQEATRLRNITDPDIRSAYSYFEVDLNLFATQMAALAPQPPLSIHPQLTAAARAHSQDMLTNNFQGHTGSTGNSSGSRLTAAGYPWIGYGENVFAYAESVEHAHAGFEVDWGFGPGGMQSPPGHRLNLHDPGFHEIGVGAVWGTNTTVGPHLVTQALATRAGLTPFVTGVVFYDFNGNSFYDPGEGIGGVQVTVSGSAYCALTSASGGYSVPVPGNTAGTVTFAVSGLPDFQTTVSVTDRNVKVDYMPSYAPPIITGAGLVRPGGTNLFSFLPVGGATAYEWEQRQRQPFTTVEGAENGLSNMTATASSGYAVVATDLFSSGTRSFHLAQPSPTDQLLQWNPVFRLGTNSHLQFSSLLGWAATGQVARAQISTNGGRSWTSVWSRAGTASAGQPSFVSVSVNLASLAGQVVEVRFVYDYVSGSYYSQTSRGVGWYLDNISMQSAEVLSNPVVRGIGTHTSFAFTAPQAAGYHLRARAAIGTRLLDWGPGWTVNALTNAPIVRIVTARVPAGGRVTLDFDVVSGTATNFVIQTALALAGPWSNDLSATVQVLAPGARFRANAQAGPGPAGFYRVLVP